MSTHDLKVWPEFFGPLESGDKPFELRRDDRDFKVGDWLKLREWAPPDIALAMTGGFTGARCLRRVSYVLRPDRALLPGFVILGLAPPITDLEFGLFGKRLLVNTIDRTLVRQIQTYLRGLYDHLEEEKRKALARRDAKRPPA